MVSGSYFFSSGICDRKATGLCTLTGAALLLLLTLSTGCGSAEAENLREVYPVTGKVFYKGEPIPDGMVSLTPVTSTNDEKPFYAPRGTVDENGMFNISTYSTGDGAPPGEYKVSFTWVGSLKGVSEDEEDKLPEKLPRKYTNPETSGITVTVQNRDNLLPPFELE